MKIHFSILFFVGVITIFGLEAAAQKAAYTDGKAAGLSAEQTAELKKLNAAIGIPTYIPTGFKLDEMKIEEHPEPEIVGYTLVYRNAARKSFMVQSINDGVGDISEPTVFGRNTYFENGVQAGYTGEDEGGIFVPWMGSKERYQPKGSLQQLYSLVADKSDISLREAVKIMASLRYLRR